MILFGYVPIKIFVSWWLPNYLPSVKYLCYLLPVCILDGKMQLIYSTYFKVIRKEKILMRVNVVSVVICFSLSLVGAYVIDDVIFIVAGINVAMFIRNMISKIYMELDLGNKTLGWVIKEIVLEILLIFVFIIVSVVFENFSIAWFSLFYLIFLMFNRKTIKRAMVNNIEL